MSATAGMGPVQGLVNNWTGGSQVVGQETPQWEFPSGIDRVPAHIREAYFRTDAGPTGMNAAQKPSPEVVSEFRRLVNAGIIRPKNAAAQNIVSSQGGLLAGDQTLLGPMINGLPSGLTPELWGQYNSLLQSAIEYQLGILEATGYLDGVPTMERDKMVQELAQQWKDRATDEFIAMETQRHNQSQEGLTQQEITNQNMQKMSELFGGQMVSDPATGQATWRPTQAASEFNTEQSGYLNGQATLTREQQAFNQAKDVAALASNPRNYIEAQMLGNARGGLGGMAPTNQIQQTTFGPPTTTQQPQFFAPGGPNNQLQTWQTMQGQAGLQPPPGGQLGSAAPVPTPQGASQPAGDPTALGGMNDPAQWQQWTNAANQQWQGAQQGMGGLPSGSGWQGLMPKWMTPQAQTPASSGVDGQAGQQPIPTSAFTQQLLRNRVVPQGGAIQGQGVNMTAGQMAQAVNPNKIRTQDYMRGAPSEQAGFHAVTSQAGWDDKDVDAALKNNLPKFRAPTQGKFI